VQCGNGPFLYFGMTGLRN